LLDVDEAHTGDAAYDLALFIAHLGAKKNGNSKVHGGYCAQHTRRVDAKNSRTSAVLLCVSLELFISAV
jgi:hypothetical protein